MFLIISQEIFERNKQFSFSLLDPILITTDPNFNVSKITCFLSLSNVVS